MSRSGVSAGLERIDGIGRCGGTHIWFEAVAAHDIDGSIEQASDILLQANIVVNRDVGFGINLDHDVGVAVGAIVAPRTRTEQSSMGHAARTQSTLMLPKAVKDFLSVHNLNSTTKIDKAASLADQISTRGPELLCSGRKKWDHPGGFIPPDRPLTPPAPQRPSPRRPTSEFRS